MCKRFYENNFEFLVNTISLRDDVECPEGKYNNSAEIIIQHISQNSAK